MRKLPALILLLALALGGAWLWGQDGPGAALPRFGKGATTPPPPAAGAPPEAAPPASVADLAEAAAETAIAAARRAADAGETAQP